MKLNFKAILSAMVVAMMSASCVEGSLELQRPGLENVDATKVELSTLVSSDASRVRPFNVFELTLASADGSVVLDAKFVSDGQPLHAATYSPASFADAHKNTYVTGADGTTLTVNGVAGEVVDGNLKVTAEGGAYTVSGTVKVTAGETTAYYELVWAGDAVSVKFKELPTLTKLSTVLSAQSNVANGTNTVTVQLATDGISKEFDMTTWQDVWTGTGAYLAADFYSEDGTLAAGTYKPSADPQNPQPGEYVKGWDPGDLWNNGMVFANWGTCWWTVNNGTTAATKITAGEIYVAYDKKSKSFTIDLDNGTQYAQFVGEIPALTPKDKPNGGAQDEVLSADIVIEKSAATLNKADDTANNTSADQSPLSGVTLWYVELLDAAGEKVAIFDLVTEEGAQSLAGEYKITSYPDEVGEAGNGFDLNFPDWGLVISGGTILYDGGNVYTLDADTGTVTVQEQNGAYKIVVKGTTTGADGATKTIAARFIVGEWKNEGGEAGGEFDGVELTQFVSFTDYKTQNGINLIGMELVSDGIEVTVEEMSWGEYTWLQTVIKGSGNHLKIEFYSENGKLAPGTYTASADQSALKEGEFGIGYDYVSDWGTSIYGSTWTTYASDQVASQEKIEDGTVVVEEDGGEYTITLVSSVATARYVGPLQ